MPRRIAAFGFGLLAETLGMQVIYYDIETKLALGNARAAPSLDILLETVDRVTLHVPETPRTHQMIRAGQLARIKKGAHLINASRGTVVDIDALVDALKSRHLAGAGIDVFRVEPKAAGQYLQTNAKIGYVVMEAETGGRVASLSVKHKLEEVPGTIRTRILY